MFVTITVTEKNSNKIALNNNKMTLSKEYGKTAYGSLHYCFLIN